MTTLDIMAPFSGWCAALDEVPDPVFAGRMLGDGLAIDPTDGLLSSPCAGEVVMLPASAHAVSIRVAPSIDILVHIGIDTVALGGRGFEALVLPGARVQIGDALIRFDLDLVARAAKSLMTPVVVSSIDGTRLANLHAPGPVSVGDRLFQIDHADTGPALDIVRPAQSATQSLPVALHHGLHARPAALIVQRAKTFAAQITLSVHGRSASARSVAAIMALGARHQDELRVEAHGADAEQAVTAVVAALHEMLQIEMAARPSTFSPSGTTQACERATAPVKDGAMRGTTAVPGYAIGEATRLERRVLAVVEFGGDPLHERAELERALAHVRASLNRGAPGGGATGREIVEAHLAFLDDPSLVDPADALIVAGKSAGFAWRAATRRAVAALQALDDVRLRERVDDLLDVESQVLVALAGDSRPVIVQLPPRAVLIARDLLPSEITALDRERLVAICLGAGGATSHVAILAAAMQLPMLVGLGGGIETIRAGDTVIVDADEGLLHTTPTADEIEHSRAKLIARQGTADQLRIAAQANCYARDGTRIEVFANVGNITDAGSAVAQGAEGCGLLRTEFLFLDRDSAPTEEEQLEAYQGIARILDGRPLILRLMDVGGDKPLRYLPLPAEENPALGLRGIRMALTRPDLLRVQLRAALRVQPLEQLRLLIPMVTDAAEILEVRRVVEAEMAALHIPGRIDIGAMIETPASALIARRIIEYVDFFSIGSNDLTQYALAMDRGHAQLAERTDALHPAVLHLIAAAADAGVARQKLVAVCGGMAADRLAVPVLLGLGVRELSVVPGAIPGLKSQIRRLSMLACRDLAQTCLELASAAEVRALVSTTVSGWGAVT